MIISQTPYRVSFVGGGTDLPAFYRREFGAVLSTAIDQHMYVTIHRRFEPTIRVSYSKTETAETIDEVHHDLVREAMRCIEIDEPLEITTIGDVPAGTGMGSSSCLTAGLLNALYAYRGQVISRQRLAEMACKIEIDILKKPIGRQDQYAAVFGGLNYIRFNSDDTVDVEPVPCKPETLEELERRALAALHGPDARRQRDPQAAVGWDRRPHAHTSPDARSSRRDASGAGRTRRPRRLRLVAAFGLGTEAVARFRDQLPKDRRMVRGRPAQRGPRR